MLKKNLSKNFTLLKIINKKEFAKKVIDKNVKAFMLYITSLLIMLIHPAKKAQTIMLIIEKIQIAAKHLDFWNVFLKKRVLVLLEATGLN